MTQKLTDEEKRLKQQQLKEKRKGQDVFIKCQEINDILNYPEPDTFRIVENIYNHDVLNILSKLDANVNGYYDIPEYFDPSSIDHIKKLKKYLKKEGHFVDYSKVIYKKGRYYCNNKVKNDSASLQNIKGRVRRLLCDGRLKGIDMCNAHIEIIKNLCIFLKIDNDKYSILNDYCENRQKYIEEIISSFKCSRDDAKEFFLILLFGGNYNTWLLDKNYMNKKNNITPFMSRFIEAYDEIKYIINKVDVLDGFKAIQKKVCNKADYTIFNSALALFLQEIESKIFIVIKNYLENMGCIIRVPIHDGIWFEDIKNICDNPSILNDIKNEIKIELNLDIPLDFDDVLATENDKLWFENHKNFYYKNKDIIDVDERSDIVYAKKILEHFKDKCFLIDKGVLVMYDEDTGMWSLYKDIHRKICLKYSTKLFPDLYMGDTQKTFDNIFSCAYKNVMSLAPFIDDWKTNDNQIGFLLFKNGVLDMKNFIMLDFNPSFRFTKRIERNFNINKDYNDGYKEIFDRLYNKQFIDDVKKLYFIEKLSRGIAGEYKDREFVLGIGETSCGKGKQTLLLNNSFGEYISYFNGEELLIKKNTNSDTARELSFIADIYDSRICISNELEIKIEGKGKFIKINGLNCNKIKKLTGGGDIFQVRKLYVNPFNIVNKSMPFLLLNDIPEVDGSDEAYIRRANYITYDRSSMKNLSEDNDSYFVADDDIDDFIKDSYIIDSYVYLICNHYKNSVNRRLERPESVIKISKEMSGFSSNNDEYFYNNYSFISKDIIESWIFQEKNEKGVYIVHWDKVGNNFIECSKVYNKYLMDGLIGSKINIGKKLINMGVITSVKRINGKSCNVYIGMSDNLINEEV